MASHWGGGWGNPVRHGAGVRCRPPPRVCSPAPPTSCPLSRVSFDTAPSPRDKSSELGFLQSAFEAACPARRLGILHLGKGTGGAGWGCLRVPLLHSGGGVDRGPGAAARESTLCNPSAQRGSPGGRGCTKPYCGLGTAATEWLLFLH